jgi:ABC-2 type transport system ATP-binding protein
VCGQAGEGYILDVLRVTGLEKAYADQRFRLFRAPARIHVLRGITFEAARGEIVGLLGANGAGKSTTLQSIAGLTIPDAGSIEIDGRPLHWREARALIGLCSSADRSFYYRLSVRENLRFFATLHGLRGTRLRQRVDDVIERLVLTEVAERRYASCSTGMRQRLSLARALLHDPPILLLDEPTRAIDPLHAERFRTFVRKELAQAQQKIVILATNVLDEAWSTCDRILLINGGRGIAVDTPAALQQRLTRQARYRITMESRDDALARRLQSLGRVSETITENSHELTVEIAQGNAAVSRLLLEVLQSPAGIRSLSLHAPSADELFRQEART